MLSKKMAKAINSQINAELYSSYLYMSMAAYLDSLQLPGFAHWMRLQAQEEMVHVIKFYNFLRDRGARVLLTAIQAPPSAWKSPQAVFEATLAHERKVTGLINKLVDLAQTEKDHASHNFLQWYVAEQVEEEASADEVLGKLKLAAQASGGLFLLDKEMAARVFTMPAGVTI